MFKKHTTPKPDTARTVTAADPETKVLDKKLRRAITAEVRATFRSDPGDVIIKPTGEVALAQNPRHGRDGEIQVGTWK